jgi:hypothetical protein
MSRLPSLAGPNVPLGLCAIRCATLAGRDRRPIHFGSGFFSRSRAVSCLNGLTRARLGGAEKQGLPPSPVVPLWASISRVLPERAVAFVSVSI